MTLLCLPTQIRFLIGGQRVTCRWSKLNDALGANKTHLLPWETTTCGLGRDQTATEVGQRFSLAIIIQEKGFIIAKAYQINKGENLNILCLQVLIWRQNGSSALGNSLFDRCRQVGK